MGSDLMDLTDTLTKVENLGIMAVIRLIMVALLLVNYRKNSDRQGCNGKIDSFYTCKDDFPVVEFNSGRG